ncbi:MAG TPA: hypothetical protein PLR76_12220 [Hyphomonas sp.]|nr:hypothetical protein [Hyphomonas sp.]
MSYPTTLADVREAALNYVPNVEGIRDEYAEVIEKATVPSIVGVFRLLSGHVDALDDDGRLLLCGAAHLINGHNFSKLRPEALQVLMSVVPTLPVPSVHSENMP